MTQSTGMKSIASISGQILRLSNETVCEAEIYDRRDEDTIPLTTKNTTAGTMAVAVINGGTPMAISNPSGPSSMSAAPHFASRRQSVRSRHCSKKIAAGIAPSAPIAAHTPTASHVIKYAFANSSLYVSPSHFHQLAQLPLATLLEIARRGWKVVSKSRRLHGRRDS